MLKILLLAYVALMPFLHAFSLLPIIAANSLILAVATPFVIARRPTYDFGFSATNMLLAAIWIYGISVWAWQPFDIMQDRLQSALQWAFSFLFLWIIVRRWIAISGVSFLAISTTSFITTVFLGLSTFFEFVLVNETGLFFSDFLPFSIEDFPYANIFGSTLIRPRAYSAEAGFTSMVFELTVPLSIMFFSRTNGIMKILFILSVGMGFITLFSTASLISIMTAVILLGALRGSFTSVKILCLSFIVTIFILFALGIDLSDLPFYKVLEFFDESNYYLTEGSRQETMAAGLALLKEYPIGMGWGTVLQESKIPGTEIDRMILGSGLISLWLEMAVAVGVIFTVVVIGHILRILIQLSKIRGIVADSSFVCLCSLSLHHFAVFESWFPMFWFALALAQVIIAQSQNSDRNSYKSANRQ